MAGPKQKPTSLSDLLSKGEGVLQRLREGGNAADRALAAARQHLPAELAGHVWAAAIDGEVLSLLCESSAWANRLRYATSGLAAAVAAELGVAVTKVVVKVRPRQR